MAVTTKIANCQRIGGTVSAINPGQTEVPLSVSFEDADLISCLGTISHQIIDENARKNDIQMTIAVYIRCGYAVAQVANRKSGWSGVIECAVTVAIVDPEDAKRICYHYVCIAVTIG